MAQYKQERTYLDIGTNVDRPSTMINVDSVIETENKQFISLTEKDKLSLLPSSSVYTKLESDSLLIKKVEFISKPTYLSMKTEVSPTPNTLVVVKVTDDEDKGSKGTRYEIWPDGDRLWNASIKDN